MKTPSNKTLILGALCLSIVASIGAFKIGEAKRLALAEDSKKQSAVYIDVQKTNKEGELLQEALRNINIDATLGTSTSENPFAPSPNDTLTDSLAKNLFLSYANQQSGGSTESDADMANALVAQINTTNLPLAPYNLASVNLFTPKSTAEIKNYGNAVGQVIKTNYTVIANNRNIELKTIAEIHKKIGDEIIAIPAPANIAQDHLAVANNYALLGESFAIIATEEKKDPLKSLLAIRTATDAADSLNNTYKQMNNYFSKNDIIFENGEAGVFWSLIVPN